MSRSNVLPVSKSTFLPKPMMTKQVFRAPASFAPKEVEGSPLMAVWRYLNRSGPAIATFLLRIVNIVSLHIEQSYDYQGDDWWKWAVWLEGSDAELDDVLS